MTTRIYAPPGSDARRAFVGASEIPALLGVSPYASAYTVWHRIVRGGDGAESIAIDIGHALEPVIRAHAARALGVEIAEQPEAYVVGRLGANLDGLTSDNRVVECKAWSARDDDAARSVSLRPDDIEPGKALCVWWQMQAQMAACGASGAVLAALCDKTLVLAHVAADAYAQQIIRAHVEAFWRDHVATGIAPDARACDVETLRRAPVSDATIDLSDLSGLLAERHRLRAEAASLSERAEAIDATVRQRLGEACSATAGEWRIKRSLVTSSRLDTTRLRAEQPQIADTYTTTTTSDRLTISNRSAR